MRLLFVLSVCVLGRSMQAELFQKHLKTNDDLHNDLERLRLQYDLPGLTFGQDDGSGFSCYVEGVRRYGSVPQIETDDTFHLGSLTKAMTATLLAILMKENAAVSWNSTLNDLLPDLGTAMHPKHRSTTLQMLTSHRSGIVIDYSSQYEVWHGLFNPFLPEPEGRRRLVELALTHAPAKVPGTFSYENTNYVIAGAIIDRHANATWERFIRTHLINPLEMTGCGFGPNPESSITSVDNPWPHIVLTESSSPLPLSLVPFAFRDNPRPFNSAGRVHCSMQAYNKFLRVHVDGARGIDSPVLGLDSHDFRHLHTPYVSSSADSARLYTLGGWNWDLLDGHVILSHEGSNGRNQAIAQLDPQSNTSLMTMTNLGGTRADNATRRVMRHFARAG